MAKSETAQIAQLDERIKSLDANIKQLITDVDAFKDRLSKTDSSGVEQMKKDYQSLQKRIEDLGKSQERTAKSVDEQIQKVSRSRRVDNKILERQNQLLAAQKRLASTGDLGQSFSSLKNSLGSIDFNSILATANAKTGGQKILQESTSGLKKAQQDYKNAVDKTTNSIKQQKSSLESMLPTLRRLTSAFGVAFSVQGLVQFGKKLVETRGEFEMQQVALRSIIQNKQLADEIWDKTMQAALQSPFTAMQLTRYTKQLAAYRIETDKLFDTTKRLADVSAGLGVDMQRLILAYGQVKAANYLRASEIRQFTEAGVNILGELSDYFARTRGEMVSTAQVMEMVQKRMVKFEDVEAIFKHMTDEGGIFYNMQYVQSQTVKGQINKLHDAYDQMLNSIGQGNQGVLKNMVSIANNLVRNWREVAGTIQGIAWAFIFVQLGKIAIGVHRIGTEAITSGSKVSWLARQLGKLREKSKGYEFGKVFSKANVVLAAGAAVAFVTGKFIQHLNAVRQLNEKYNELSLRAYETQENLSGIQKTLSQNNQSIERLNKVSKKSKEQEEELANTRKQNAEIVNKLKREYPELADGMNIQKNGIVTLTSAISDYNEQLEYTILLNQLAKGNTWNDDFQTNVTEMTQSLQSAEQTLASYQSLAKSILLQMKNMDFGFREKSQAKGLKELLEGIIGLEKGDYEGLNKLLSGNRLSGYNRFTQTRSWRTAFQPIFLDEHNIKATKKQLERSESVLYDLLKVSIRRDKEYMTEISKEWGGDIDKFIHNNAERIQKNVDDGKKDTFKAIREYGLQMGFAFKGAQDIFNQTLNRGDTSLFGGLGFRFFEYPGVGETGTDQETLEEKQAKIDAAWRRRIQLLEEMKKRYDELSKSAYGYAKSNSVVRREFKESWEKIFGKTLSMDAIAFMSASDMEASFETILKKAGAASEAVREEIQKKADSYGARIPIDVQVRIREDFGRQMEEAFGNYELTLELQKLNIPDDVAKDLFPDFDAETLGDLQGRMRMFLKEQGENFDEDDLKKYEEWSKKVESEILKYRKDKAKQYSKYLEKEYSDRAKLQMQYAKDVAFVTANFKDEKQRDNIIKNIDKKFQDDLNNLNWKSFKESDFYVEMMEDISSLPAEYTQMMLDKLNEILENPETLSPRALKEAINARQKVLDAQIATQPIKLISTSVKEIRDAAKDLGGNGMLDTKKRVDEEIVSVQREINEYNELIVCLQNTQGEMKAYEDAVKSTEDAYGGLTLQTRRAIDMLGETHALGMFQHTMEENQRSIDEINEKEEEGGKLDSADRQRRKRLQAENDLLAAQIKLINDWIEAKRKEEGIRMRQVGTEAEYKRGQGETSSDVGEQITSAQEETDTRTKRVQELKQWQKAFLNFTKGWESWNGAVNDAINKVSSMGNAVYDMYDALGGETNALTEGWKEFGNTLTQTITSTLTLIPQLVAGFVAAGTSINAAMGIVGLIAEAVQLVVTMIGAIAKLHDAHYEKEIENQQKKIDALKDAYARLEKQIERTWDSVSYMSTYNQQIQNLNEQYKALSAQIASEEAKKNTDKDKLKGYQNEQQQILDQLDEIKQKQIEVFGGIGEDSYRSVAEGFVDAWKQAFLETGDGLQALQDHFDEFLQDWFVKQATMRIAGKMLESTFNMIDDAVNENGEGGVAVTAQELAAIRDKFAAVAPELSDALEQLAGMWGLQGEGGLSGLAAGIQGMTEEQANILEAYWNSVRMYTASIDMNVARIAEMLGVGGANTNPLLQQMTLVAANTQATHQLLQSVVKSGHSQGGYGIKVFND